MDHLRSAHRYQGSDRNSCVHRAWVRRGARMSGTAYGTVVLHVAPEAAAGGPLALMRTGDIITLGVENRSEHMDVSDEELQSRMQSPRERSAYAEPTRGWARLYVDHVMQSDTGADLDFPVASSGDKVSRESH